MKEKRQFRRKPIAIDVVYDMSSDQMVLDSKAKDISVGGICLVSRKQLVVDKIMDFKFTIPDSEKKIQISGKVVWTEKSTGSKDDCCYSGIQFVRIDNADRDLIGKFVDGATFVGNE
jgi:c-di-GMP-binding flagellar brake protein YcgR